MKLLTFLAILTFTLTPTHCQPEEHFYSIDPNAGSAGNTAGFSLTRLVGFAFSANQPGSVPMYSFVKASSKYLYHFYTTDPNGESAVADGFTLEGTAWFGPAGSAPGAVPLLRYRNSQDGRDHFYATGTTTTFEYVYEGIAGYVFTDATAGGVPISEYLHPQN